MTALAASAVFAVTAQAGMIVSSGKTAEELANAIVGSSSGITIANPSFTGLGSMNGTFTGGNSAGLGFDTGIILTSGSAGDIPLASSGSGSGMSIPNDQAGDAKLDTIVSPNSTYDASVLSFDFTPTGNKVQFWYVFASTEYNFYVNSVFDDVFAFFVNDVNYALIPGTTTPVSVNTVNCGTVQPDGPTPGTNATNCDKFRDNRNVGGSVGASALIDHGGLTNVFSFIADVNPNQVNKMYLAIADTSDWVLDSSVFIKGGSFTVFDDPGQPNCGEEDDDVPEPGTLALLGLGLAGLGLSRRRKH